MVIGWGVTNNIQKNTQRLKRNEIQRKIRKTVSLVFDYDTAEFHIYTEGGRLIRPYLNSF